MTDRQYLHWLLSRLSNKYQENIDITDRFTKILKNFVFIPKKMNKKTIDACCRKHFLDFDLEKSHDVNLGYTEEERNDIRRLITDIHETILSNT